MAGPYLIDTNVLVELVNGKTVGKYLLTNYQLDYPANRPLISIVTHGEIRSLSRVWRWAGTNKEESLEKALANVVTVDINHQDVIDRYAEMYEASKKHADGDRSTGLENDLWIAACARAYGATLITLDKDFDHLHPAHVNRIYVDRQQIKQQARG